MSEPVRVYETICGATKYHWTEDKKIDPSGEKPPEKECPIDNCAELFCGYCGKSTIHRQLDSYGRKVQGCLGGLLEFGLSKFIECSCKREKIYLKCVISRWENGKRITNSLIIEPIEKHVLIDLRLEYEREDYMPYYLEFSKIGYTVSFTNRAIHYEKAALDD